MHNRCASCIETVNCQSNNLFLSTTQNSLIKYGFINFIGYWISADLNIQLRKLHNSFYKYHQAQTMNTRTFLEFLPPLMYSAEHVQC